jgi:hypothetical protein
MSVSYGLLDEVWARQPDISIDQGTSYTGGHPYKTDMKSVINNLPTSNDSTSSQVLQNNNDQFNDRIYKNNASRHVEYDKPYQPNLLLQDDDRNKQIVPAPDSYLNCLNYTTAANNSNSFIDKSIMMQQLLLIIQRMEKKIDKLEEEATDRRAGAEPCDEEKKVVEGFSNLKTNSVMDYVILVFMGIVIIFVMDSVMKMGRKSCL